MKASVPGPIVAKALQNFPGIETIPCPSQPNSDISQPDLTCGKIIVFVNIGWYDQTRTSEDLAILNIIRKDLSTVKKIMSRFGIIYFFKICSGKMSC